MKHQVWVCDYPGCVKYGQEVKNPVRLTADPTKVVIPAQTPPVCQNCHQPLRFLREEVATQGETVAVGAIAGVVIGSLLGGPAGAVIGGMIGSAFGQMNYEQERRNRQFGGF